jgi:DNA-binding Xre family transcriptional regulator
VITNERQYQISKAQIAKFRAAIDAPDGGTRDLHPRAQRALREATQSQLDDLLVEVAEFERLREGDLTAITADSIADLAPALIKARIMRNWTQKELADKLSVAEQQIQRYEATQYKGVSVERLQAVADALKLRVREVITFEPL